MPPDLEAQDAHYQAIIADLIDEGARIVRDLAIEGSPAIAKAEPYERLARAIRRSIVLGRHIGQNPLKLRQPPAEAIADRAAPTRTSAPASAAARNPLELESLRPERPERMHEDLAGDLEITQRPLDDAIGQIRRDLGFPEPPPKPALFALPGRQPLYVDADDIDDLDDLETDEALLHDTIRRPTKTPDG